MRISVNLSEDTLKRVDAEAKKMGTSRGAMLNMWINEKLTNIDMAQSMVSQILESDSFKEYFSKALSESVPKEVIK